jgi:hypothetical protein
MICSCNSGEKLASSANRAASTLFKIAPQTTSDHSSGDMLARPNAPPKVLMKLRAPVTTARSFLGEVAWAATSAIISGAL